MSENFTPPSNNLHLKNWLCNIQNCPGTFVNITDEPQLHVMWLYETI